MQFTWKYIDDFMGKGLETSLIIELFVYVSANLVTMALPLAVLLGSIMTFGNLAENYELVAMKSSGLSLFKIMFPLIILIFIIALGAFYFSNNITPVANLKFKSLLWDITQAKPTMELKDGVFYNGLDGYSIRVSKVDKKNQILNDVLIYDHKIPEKGNRTVVRAKKGIMQQTADQRYLILNLFNGVTYDESIETGKQKSYPLIKNKFEKDVIAIDLSGFMMKRTDEDLWKNHMQMMSINQLSEAIDSLGRQQEKRKSEYQNYLSRNIDAVYKKSNKTKPYLINIPNQFSKKDTTSKIRTINMAMNSARNAKSYIGSSVNEIETSNLYIAKHKNEWHLKLTLSFACIILFFIGAPLGAIIKKGGLGLPVVFSVAFFLIFHIANISGQKMSATGVLEPFYGMWLSSMILFPISIFLTYKAAKDAALFDMESYTKLWNKLKDYFQNRKLRINKI
jgi:lipopolysaccharide export system permease protein